MLKEDIGEELNLDFNKKLLLWIFLILENIFEILIFIYLFKNS